MQLCQDTVILRRTRSFFPRLRNDLFSNHLTHSDERNRNMHCA